MKAKTYYMLSRDSPRLALRLLAPNHPKWTKAAHGGFDVPVKVIKSSDVEKLVEKAARGIRSHLGKTYPQAAKWSHLPDATKELYRAEARAAFKAIGLLP